MVYFREELTIRNGLCSRCMLPVADRLDGTPL